MTLSALLGFRNSLLSHSMTNLPEYCPSIVNNLRYKHKLVYFIKVNFLTFIK